MVERVAVKSEPRFDQQSSDNENIILLPTPPMGSGLLSGGIDNPSTGIEIYISTIIEPNKPLIDPLKDLVDRAQKDDQAALTALCEVCLPKVYSYSLRKLGNVPDAEDATNETFTKMFKSIGDYKSEKGAFLSWLLRIARNHIIDTQCRSNIRHRRICSFDQPKYAKHLGDNGSSAEYMAMLVQVEEVVRACERLSQDERQVLQMRCFEGFSVPDTATALGKPIGTVKSIKRRALAKLQQILKEEYTMSTPFKETP